jgi:hypothetical protein
VLCTFARGCAPTSLEFTSHTPDAEAEFNTIGIPF